MTRLNNPTTHPQDSIQNQKLQKLIQKYYKKMHHRNLESQIDHLLELPSQQIVQQISNIKDNNQQNFNQLCVEIKHLVLNQLQNGLNYRKLVLLRGVCEVQGRIGVDQGCFKCGSVYQLVAVAQGYMMNGADIKGNFMRNLKRTPPFWGTTSIENIYQALINKSTPALPKPIDTKSKLYLWQFIKNNQQLFPSNFDYYEYAVKHMLMLRTDRKEQLEVFNIIMEIFSKYSHSYQIMSKNFRFILEFFKTPLSEKELGYFPCQVAKRLLNNYPIYQVDNIFAMGSLGLNWSQNDVLNCTNNVLKLGITQSTYRLFKSFIQMFKRLKKFTQLVQAFEKNIHKIFIFLKYPQLYSASLKTLKEFILGPWPVSTLYNSFAIKATDFAKTKNLSQFKDFVLLLSCVIQKYKQSTIVSDLQELIRPFSSLCDEINPQKIRSETLQYDWRVFQTINVGNKDNKGSKEDIQESRGFVNIGNSCYMNSFLQSLYMTREYRRTVLEASTLNVQKVVLSKLEKLHEKAREGKNLALIARETVRPLAELQRTFSLLLKSKRSAINPSNIKKISPPEFQNMNQHDCIEFGRFLIETISRSIDHVFEGEITTQIQCPYCGAKRQKNQQFLDLMLSSASGQDTQTIEGMVQASLEDQYLEDLKCQACNNIKPLNIKEQPNKIQQQQQPQKQQDSKIDEQPIINKSIKRHWISKYPNYLILTLKRFEYNIKENKNIKKQYKLELNQIVKINEIQYLIYAFIVHRGVSANSGHYFTFARMSYQENVKDWLCLNDSTVTKLDQFPKVMQFLSANQQDTPYIIFCMKKQYWQQNSKKLQQPLTLRAPLQSFIEKDDAEYLKQMNKKGGGNIDLSLLKFATGNFYRKDEDDNGPGNGMGGGFNNNPIM